MVTFTQLWVIFDITGQPAYLGLVGLMNAVPAIALNLFGGVFADRLDKRRLIIVTQFISSVLIFILGALTFLDMVNEFHVLIIAFFTGAVNAFDQPARQALYPHLIDRKVMMSAVALNASVWQGTRITSPAAAGAIIAILGAEYSFFIASAGFFTMAAVLVGLKIPKIERGATGNPLRDVLDGLKFIWGNSIFSFLIGMTFFNSFFGMAYVMMMPVFVAKPILNLGADGQGLLLLFGGLGALITTLWIGSLGNFRQKGLLLIGGAVMFGISIALFALTSLYIRSPYLAMFMMFVAGVFNSVYMISVMSSLQMMVPDNMRGRVMGFYGMTYSIMPLGGMQAGFLATFVIAPSLGISSVLATPFAVALGGIIVTVFALGPALINRNVRNIGSLLINTDRTAAAGAHR
jgi:MFS family permease